VKLGRYSESKAAAALPVFNAHEIGRVKPHLERFVVLVFRLETVFDGGPKLKMRLQRLFKIHSGSPDPKNVDKRQME
jgi:hypothetical protein